MGVWSMYVSMWCDNFINTLSITHQYVCNECNLWTFLVAMFPMLITLYNCTRVKWWVCCHRTVPSTVSYWQQGMGTLSSSTTWCRPTTATLSRRTGGQGWERNEGCDKVFLCRKSWEATVRVYKPCHVMVYLKEGECLAECLCTGTDDQHWSWYWAWEDRN